MSDLGRNGARGSRLQEGAQVTARAGEGGVMERTDISVGGEWQQCEADVRFRQCQHKAAYRYDSAGGVTLCVQHAREAERRGSISLYPGFAAVRTLLVVGFDREPEGRPNPRVSPWLWERPEWPAAATEAAETAQRAYERCVQERGTSRGPRYTSAGGRYYDPCEQYAPASEEAR